MDKTQIFIFAFAMIFLGFRLYQKYIKKDKNKSSAAAKSSSDKSQPSLSKDDDYEPYSKK